MAMKGNLLPEATFTVFLLSPACCLASLMIFFPGLPTNKVLMTSVYLRRLSPVPLQKSSALCLSTSTDFHFAKQGHPSERTLVFSAPLQSTIPKPAVPLPSPWCLSQRKSYHLSTTVYCPSLKSNCFLFKTPNVYDCVVTHKIVNELHVKKYFLDFKCQD